MKDLFILRGLPGSGKSTLARTLSANAVAFGYIPTIRSTDDQFMVDGKYTFNPRMLGVNHNKNQQLVRHDMEIGVDCIIVDNTNIKRRDFATYIALAKEFGYTVHETVCGMFDEDSVKFCHSRNTHGVPIEAVRRMAQNFEA
jgi:predicted kinase